MKLSDWYIEKEKKNIIAHGKVYNNPKFEDGIKINTSPIQTVEIIGSTLTIHTKNSMYRCDLKDCWYFYQRQIDILPFSIDEAKKKYYMSQLIVANKIVITVDLKTNYYLNFVAVYCKNKKNIHLPWIIHLGMFTDTVLIGKPIDLDINIDIRYYVNNNSIEFYMLNTNKLPVYIHNKGKNNFICTTIDGKIINIASSKIIKI